MTPTGERFTASGVRLRLHRRASATNALDWLLLPGGPGLGSESLVELADALDVSGSIWLVDLPGDGSNVTQSPTAFDAWPHALVEAAQEFPRAVFVGHSTGGMYLLSVPELESHLVGLALVSSAPDASWRSSFVEMTKRHPLPAVDIAMRAYEANKTSETLRDLTIASAEWSFTPPFVDLGREMLRRLPYAVAPVDWSERNFDDAYVARWWPRSLPTLIVSGAEDRVVAQSIWTAEEHRAANVIHRTVPGAGHFPWVEKPDAIRAAFVDFARRVSSD